MAFYYINSGQYNALRDLQCNAEQEMLSVSTVVDILAYELVPCMVNCSGVSTMVMWQRCILMGHRYNLYMQPNIMSIILGEQTPLWSPWHILSCTLGQLRQSLHNVDPIAILLNAMVSMATMAAYLVKVYNGVRMKYHCRVRRMVTSIFQWSRMISMWYKKPVMYDKTSQKSRYSCAKPLIRVVSVAHNDIIRVVP